MACYSPLHGYQSRIASANGKHALTFSRSSGFVDKVMTVPCGQCIGCRIDRTRMWALRCSHESKMHQNNCFITLTYDKQHLPEDTGLVKKHLQDFFRRLRKSHGTFRYFAAGEYGERDNRPHYHAIIFGLDFAEDRKFFKTTPQGHKLFISKTLTETWQNGHATVASFSYSTASYTARYVLKKVTGKDAPEFYQRLNIVTGELVPVLPEFSLMSLKPGIGATWYDKFKKDAFPSDFLIHEGKKHTVPRFYADRLKRDSEQIHKEVKLKRKKSMIAQAHNATPDRLAVREECKKSQIKTLSRSL